MIKYAITGNIACGKSTAEKILTEAGFKTADSDEIAHNLLDCNEVKIAFADYDVFEAGKISRQKLGRLVFKNNELKNKLEQILHPKIRAEIIKFFTKNQPEKAVFVSVPLLFEAGMENMFDRVIMLYADDEIRLQRLIIRNGYDENYAKIRMSCQMPQDIKAEKSDIVIYNNSTVEELKKQILTSIG